MSDPASNIPASRVSAWLTPGGIRRPDARSVAFAVAAAAIVLYAAALRVEALIGKYGHMPRPAWTQALDRVAAVSSRLHPSTLRWRPVTRPYEGGDPINYLQFAREMTGFYQAHVREPVFLALTRGWLLIFHDADIGLSASSAFASVLMVLATILLGQAYASRAVGLGAGLLLAIAPDAIFWSVDGWRDDAFALMVTLSTWRFLRLRQQPGVANGAAAGIAAAAACLTRLSSLSFVLPACLWIPSTASASDRRRTVVATAVAAAVAAVLVAPYLIACARAFGDPFFAVNTHTGYYRAHEGMAYQRPQGALSYMAGKFTSRPVATVDTFAGGLFTFPLRDKFDMHDRWVKGLSTVLIWSTVVGLLLALGNPDGRLMLLVLFTSLVPYSLTWSVGGGGMWRFSEHTYGIYLVCGCDAFRRLTSVAWRLVRRQLSGRDVWMAVRVPLAACLAVTVVVIAAYRMFPMWVAREALRHGDAVTIAAGPRDDVFFSGAWSEPSGRGTVQLRAAEDQSVAIRIPVPRDVPFRLTLRVDPAETADPNRQPRVAAFLDRRRIADLVLTRTPGRVGAYWFDLPATDARGGVRDLELLASHTVPAREAGPNFRFVKPETPVAFRMWYVRVEPLGETGDPRAGR